MTPSPNIVSPQVVLDTDSAVSPNALTELALLHQQYVKGLETLTAMADREGENLITKRPWIDEPSGSVSLDEQGGIDLPLVGAEATVLEYIVPTGYDGVIKWVNNNVNFGGFVQFSGDIVWRFEINNRPVKNFENVRNEKGTIAIPRMISPIRLYSGDVVRWVVNHVANAALAGQVICGFGGYTYPSKGVV